MRLPRDVSGVVLVKSLQKMGYVKTRQTGSHIRLCRTANGEHYLTIPAHDPLKLGTLAAIIADVALHMKISKEETISLIFE